VTRAEGRSMDTGKPAMVYTLVGPLFFGSFRSFKNAFEVESDPEQVILDVSKADIQDLSALATMKSLGKMYADSGKMLTLEGKSASVNDLPVAVHPQCLARFISRMSGRHVGILKLYGEWLELPQTQLKYMADSSHCETRSADGVVVPQINNLTSEPLIVVDAEQKSSETREDK
ncbi:hypothetical protein CYMTET_42380, partial [Cymbomonas tetramitiformis]